MAEEKIVIIGGVAAGMSAAAKAARVNPNAEITVFTNEDYISYGACGFPYFVAGEIEGEHKLVARTVEQFRANNINVSTKHLVEQILPEEKKVLVKNLSNHSTFAKEYTRLVIATGAQPFVPPIEGTNLNNVFVLRNMEQGLAIKNHIVNQKPNSAVIVGGGYLGIEMAEALIKVGCQVTILELASQIVPNMNEDMALLVQEYLSSLGATILTGEKLLKLTGQDRLKEVHTDKRAIPADMVLMSVGTIPNSRLAAEAGIKLGIKNAIEVNTRMETSLEDIYACGDCATVHHRIINKDVYIPLGTTANKQGKTAGENAAGGNTFFTGVLGTGIAKVMDLEVARTGLSGREAREHGINFVETTIKSRTTAHYYPGSSDITIKLIAEKETGKLLGAQIVGGRGAGKRIDVFAACLHLEAKVNDLQDLDLAYAPPFSPVYDSILVGLTDLQKKLSVQNG